VLKGRLGWLLPLLVVSGLIGLVFLGSLGSPESGLEAGPPEESSTASRSLQCPPGDPSGGISSLVAVDPDGNAVGGSDSARAALREFLEETYPAARHPRLAEEQFQQRSESSGEAHFILEEGGSRLANVFVSQFGTKWVVHTFAACKSLFQNRQ
jgi:hypothetical protein